jgi:CO/xanthine dehydrogenase FAD-binding subunit
MMNMRLSRPNALDISRIESVSGIEANGALRVGAVARQKDVLDHEVIQRGWPLITSALKYVGHPATPARGTFGGSLAHTEPVAELPTVILALGGSITARGPGSSLRCTTS